MYLEDLKGMNEANAQEVSRRHITRCFTASA